MEMQLPPVLLESVRRPHGLILLTGTRNSGLPETVAALAQHSGKEVFSLGKDADLKRSRSADVIVFDGDLDESRLDFLIGCAEEGRMVLLAQACPAPLTGLRRMLSFDGGRGRAHKVHRLAEQLILMSGQMRLRSLQAGAMEDAREIILITPAIREAARQENIVGIEELLKAGDETSGMVSFNQSLLQLLLRRRIDIKTAFEASWDPGHLDQILKKVGI